MPRPQHDIIDLLFPAGGLDRHGPYRSQPPYTTPDAKNVRPFGTLEGRMRGGSRPGIRKAYYQELGSGEPIRLLDGVSYVAENGLERWDDTFDGGLSSAWSAPSWGSLSLPGVVDGAESEVSYTESAGAVRDALDIDTGEIYYLAIYIVPYEAAHHGKYRIYARMDDTSPDATDDGIVAEIVLEGAGGAVSGNLYAYASGSLASTTAFSMTASGSALPGWFMVKIDGNDVTCYWLGTALHAAKTVGAAAGTRFGFGMECTVEDGRCFVDKFRIAYANTSGSTSTRRMLVASADGDLYVEDAAGVMGAVSTNLALMDDRVLESGELLQKLYIADWEEDVVAGTDGTIANTNELTDTGVSDWTALDFNIYDYVVEITETSGPTTGTYAISSIVAAKVTLATAPGNGTCEYRILRAIKVYDPSTGALTVLAAAAGKGQVPHGCPLLAVWNGRLVLAKDHIWYMPRQDDPTDWDYGADADDAQRAIAGTNADAGQIGEPITALVPFTDDYLIFGCQESLWVMRGDPAYGGRIDSISRSIGIVGPRAFCNGPTGTVFFLSRDGLYAMTPGSLPQSLSREKMPRELVGFDPSVVNPQLCYDSVERGIHIFLTTANPGEKSHFWYDLSTSSYWEDSYPNDQDPSCAAYFRAWSAADSGVLIGGRDGYIRRFDPTIESDDGVLIDSYCVLGPVKLGGLDNVGLVERIECVLASDSGDMSIGLYTGETAEAAAKMLTLFDTATMVAGDNYSWRPRCRGTYFALKLYYGENVRSWSMEELRAVRKSGGRRRKI